MSISQRITSTIEDWRKLWGEALRNFLSKVLAWGIELFFDVIAKSASPKLTPFIETLEKTGKVPPELKPLLDEIKTPSGEVAALFAQSAGSQLVGGALGAIINAIFLPLAYAINSLTRNVILDEGQLLALWLRDKLPEDKLREYLSWKGRAEDDIDGLIELTKYIPSAPEQVSWLAREVYEPEMVSKYGLDDELPNYEETDFKKVGVTPEQMRNYWRAHWEHASWTQVIEMLHRGELTESDVWEWFRLVEIPPFWRQKLINVSWNVPTRVDVRRWWDMRTIDEARLREIYQWLGYHGKDLEDYIKWTKVYTDFPMMMARFKNGWITEDDIRSWLISLDIPSERVEQFIQEKTKPEKPERVAKERDLTKTEIYKGVKKGLISWQEGVELLLDLGYDEFEANYILAINVGALEGSPETYPEFKHITQLYRKSQGLKAMEVPQEIIDASKELAKARAELKEAEAKGLEGAPLAPYLKAVSDAEYRYRQLLVKWEEEKKKLS